MQTISIPQAVLLGIVQGVSEFLPISSDGHLSLVQQWLGLTEDLLVFDVFLHFFTFLAIIVFFAKEILLLRLNDIKVLVIGTIPAVVVGLLFEDTIEALLHSTLFVSVALIITGIGNFIAHYAFQRRNQAQPVESHESSLPRHVSYSKAFLIGLLQSVAILPGISRSGSTVMGAAVLGMSRMNAFRFSFLLGLPAIFGASVLQAYKVVTEGLGTLSMPVLLVGGVTAGLVGFASLGLFSLIVRKGQLQWFGWYCVTIGIVSLVITQV